VESEKKTRKKLSLSAQIMIGIALGLAAGIFFGEYCSFLAVIGTAFIKLLQMTILPYITVSLILGIGGLTLQQARLLARKAGLLLLLFWAIAFVMVLLLPLSFPKWKSAAFFSSAIVELPKPVDFLGLYIPSNPFYSLANNIIPAVVLFSILAGVALMGMENKFTVLEALKTASQALIRMTNFIVKLTPIGVFAITASAAGTMTVDEFGRLQVYLVSYNVAALFVTLFILPMLVTPFTPFKYKDIFRFTRGPLLTAFTTGNLFIVLTVLTESCKQLFEKYKLKEEKTDTYVDVIMPVSFNFPNIGKLLMLLFILFAAWFMGSPVPVKNYPSFVFSGLLSFFGGVDVAIPFMLDLMHIPSDLYQLYVVTGVINGRFATLVAAMNLVVFTLLATASLTGVMSMNKKKLLRYAGTSALLTAVLILGLRVYFAAAVKNVYTKDQVLANMESLVFRGPRKVYKSAAEAGERPRLELPLLERIKKSGVLRVGFTPGNLPFTYFGRKGGLIGLDVDMAQLLAEELNIKPEFVPIEISEAARVLEEGAVDIIMSGFVVTTPRLEKMTISDPYLENTLCFMVPDYRRSEFSSDEALHKIPKLKLGIPKVLADYFSDPIRKYLPQAEIVEVESFTEFFETNPHKLDALLMDAERGSAWTLLYPEYKAVVPLPRISKILVSYPVASRDLAFARFISQWIKVKKASGQFKKLYNHWILGTDAVPRKPRWCILRDVLKWVE